MLMIIPYIVLTQATCLVYAVIKGECPTDTCYGFAIWGVIPILIVGSLST